MFTKLYGLPKERQTAFSNDACSCLRCASCVKLVLIIIKRIYLSTPVRIIKSSDYRRSVLLYTHEGWVWFPVCPL